MSAYSLLLLSGVIFLLQSSFLPFLFNGIMQPDLWLTVIALSSLVVDRKTAILLAAIGGLLQDVVTSNFFGLHLLPYLGITLLFLKFGRDRYNKHWHISLSGGAAGFGNLRGRIQHHHGMGRQPVSLSLLFRTSGHSPGPYEWRMLSCSS